jgi:hypothetical protein
LTPLETQSTGFQEFKEKDEFVSSKIKNAEMFSRLSFNPLSQKLCESASLPNADAASDNSGQRMQKS